MRFRRTIVCLSMAGGLAVMGEAAAHAGPAGKLAALETSKQQGDLTGPVTDPVQGGIKPPAMDPLTGSARAQAPVGREPRGNPLWAVPLSTLSATRERPIFLPSRRMPTPAVVGPPVETPRPPAKPSEPDRPGLALVGAIVGETEGIAIFIDEATRDIVRLRTGESHAGWVLRSVKGREATLQKERETAVLALPAPTDAQNVKKEPEL